MKGKKPKDDDLRDMLNYLIPNGDHFSSSLILDLNLIVFIIMVFSGVSIMSPKSNELLFWGGVRRSEVLNGEWWRLLTNMFVHSGLLHILYNGIALVLVGVFVEPIFGRKRYLIIYFVSGICGSLASIWWYENTVSVGASGAIFGLFGAILSFLFIKDISKDVKKYLFMIFGTYVFLNLIAGMSKRIDNAGHIGGLLSGMVLSLIFYKLYDISLKD